MEGCPWWTEPLWPVSSLRDRYGLSWAKRTARHPSGQTQLPNMKGVSPHMGRLSQAVLWTPHWREQGPSSLTITGPYHKAPWQMTHNSFQRHVNGLELSVVIALCGSKWQWLQEQCWLSVCVWRWSLVRLTSYSYLILLRRIYPRMLIKNVVKKNLSKMVDKTREIIIIVKCMLCFCLVSVFLFPLVP